MALIETKVPRRMSRHVREYGTFRIEPFPDGDEYQFAVVRPRYGKILGLPEIFIICTDDGILAISENYPEDWREVGLMYAILGCRAFFVENKDSERNEDAWLKVIEDELQIARNLSFDTSAYLPFREKFFAGLVEYYEKKGKEKRTPEEETLLSYFAKIRDHLHMRLEEFIAGTAARKS